MMFALMLTLAAAPDDGLAERMRPVYVAEAAAYSVAVASAPDARLELKKEPVFEWLNPDRATQQGAVFVWLRAGRPAALACVFSHPHFNLPGRQINHELHALDSEKLIVTRPDALNRWEPKAGFARTELADAPKPAATPGGRLLQMRRLATEFGGHTTDRDGKRWELRLLPSPLFRYPEAKTGVIDGALFALVSTAGTDPEALLLVEAQAGRWQFAVGRFTDWELRVRRKEAEVFTSVPGPANPFAHDPLHLYRLYPEKVIGPDGKLLARLRQTGTGPNSQLIPVVEK